MMDVVWGALALWLYRLCAISAYEARGGSNLGGEVLIPVVMIILLVGYKQIIDVL